MCYSNRFAYIAVLTVGALAGYWAATANVRVLQQADAAPAGEETAMAN
jgi:hypothetical protein